MKVICNAHSTPMLLFVAALSVAGCGSTVRDPIECVDDTSCGLAADGVCSVNPATGNQFCTYPDTTCPGGRRWSDFDVEPGVSGACVADTDAGVVDSAGIDAPPAPASFALGAVTEWRIGVRPEPTRMTVTSWVRVVNTGDAPLDLSAARVSNLTLVDDRFEATALWVGSLPALAPGRSAGALLSDAARFIVSSGLVPEPAQDTANDMLELRVTRFPSSGAWLVTRMEITVEIQGAQATIPVDIVLSGDGTPAGTPFAGQRILSAPIP